MRGLNLFMFILLLAFTARGQDDLLKMLEEETKSDEPDFTTATFKTTRIINGHSIENVAHGVLDFRISHRFGFINSGIKEFYGLDQAYMRLGFDYGLTNRWMIGIGRSSYQKQLDGFTKFKVLRQSSGSHPIPVSVSMVSSMTYDSGPFPVSDRKNYHTSKMYFAHQVLVARKFNESVSFQLMPTMVHYNLIPGTTIPNDLFSIGAGGRVKLTKRVSVNAEYFYRLPGNRLPDTYNSLSVGFDIETGGHVFQLHFTNSTGMTERTFITETNGDFMNGDIHFGFNISRVFTLQDPRK